MPGDTDTILLHPNPHRLTPLCIVSGLLAALCGTLAWLVPWASSCFDILAGATALFGALFVFVVFRIARPRTTLVIDRDGLIDRSTVTAAGRVSWSEIDRVTTFKFLAQSFVGIWLKEPTALVRRLPPIKARLVEKNLRKGFPPVWIPAAMVSTAPPVLAELITGRLARSR
jgi:hypothetical protein